METIDQTRRTLLKGSACAAALMSLPLAGRTASPSNTRLEWQTFRTTPQYASFLNAIQLMQAVSDATDPASWAYWVNVHVNFCPHMLPYFFAWHRGYLFYFEQQLRIVSGDNTVTLPYWDYYSYPTIPGEFLDNATGNPLYVDGRVNASVYNALTMEPFSATINNFGRGTPNSYEASFEAAPHNPVHDIIGGWMADVRSPTDPIFYLHHANVDRLFDAWARLAQNNYPAPSSSYWSDSFTYAEGLTMAKSDTYQPSLLGYRYADSNLPTALPPSAQRGSIIRVQAQLSPIHARPPVGDFARVPPRKLSATRCSLGGAANLKLDENSVSALVAFTASDAIELQNAVCATVPSRASTVLPPDVRAIPRQVKHAYIVLAGASVTSLGKQGGYFYNMYINLPAKGDVDAISQSRFVGTVGPFEISAAMHHVESALALPANDVLHRMTPAELKEVVISLVRVNGTNSPKGLVMVVRELRVELSTDPGRYGGGAAIFLD